MQSFIRQQYATELLTENRKITEIFLLSGILRFFSETRTIVTITGLAFYVHVLFRSTNQWMLVENQVADNAGLSEFLLENIELMTPLKTFEKDS